MAWTGEETWALVSVWGEANIQEDLDGVTRNKIIYEKITKDMEGLGYTRTWKQCRTKIKNLTQAYRKVANMD